MYRGEYKKFSSDGTLNVYSAGDYALYQGKLWKAQSNTNSAPWEVNNPWEFTGTTETYISDSTPINPVKGQFWVTNGRMYVYYYDGNSYSWVEM